MRSTRSACLLTLLLCLAGRPAIAEVEFTASVDRVRTTRAQPLQLTLSIVSTENIAHMPAPDLNLDDFVVEGPSVSVRKEIFNSTVTHARQLTYTLYAREEGTFVIGPARLELAGQVFETKPVHVVVGKSSRGGKGKPGQGESSLEDNLFVRVTGADIGSAYVGQQVTLSYDLCYRYQLRDVGFKEIPAYSGFWVKELFVAQRLQPRREIIDGVQFNVAPLRKLALFPTSSGKQNIEPLAISCGIPKKGRRSNSLFDAFSLFDDPFARSQSLLVRSADVGISVLPLPESGRPPEFSGLVGSFSLRSTLQPKTVAVGDPVTLRVAVDGYGNLGAVGEPILGDLSGFKLYDPKVSEDLRVDGDDRYGGRKVFEYILIPEKSGDLVIPPATLSFFDPDKVKYSRAETASYELTVEGELREEQSANIYSLSRREIEMVGSDIRHIKPDVAELGSRGFLYRSRLFWLGQLAIPFAYVGLFLRRRHRIRLEGDVAYARRRGARSAAEKKLKTARQLLAEGRAPAVFYGEVERAVLSFVADHVNRSPTGLGKQGCAEVLRAGGADAETVAAVVELLEHCEMRRYAPGEESPAEMRRTQDRVEDLVSDLEKVLR